jgi:hypothetical protein
VLKVIVEVRQRSGTGSPWGVAIAAIELLVVVPGIGTVNAVEIMKVPGGMTGAVQIQASLQLDLPVALLDVLELATEGTVQGNGADHMYEHKSAVKAYPDLCIILCALVCVTPKIGRSAPRVYVCVAMLDAHQASL